MNSIRSCYTCCRAYNGFHKWQTEGRLYGYERSRHILAFSMHFALTADQFDKPKPPWAIVLFLWMLFVPYIYMYTLLKHYSALFLRGFHSMLSGAARFSVAFAFENIKKTVHYKLEKR